VSASNGDGVSTFPTSLDSALVYLSVQSGNQFAITIDESGGQGQITLEKSQGPYTYSIDSNGRMTLGSGQPVFYPANGAQAFGTEQPSSTNQGGPSLITVQQQVSGTFGCAADSGFCREELMAWCEQNQVDYVFGLARNQRLRKQIDAGMEQARALHMETGKAAQGFTEFTYQTRKSWSRPQPRNQGAGSVVYGTLRTHRLLVGGQKLSKCKSLLTAWIANSILTL
jgi:hypothetical protein